MFILAPASLLGVLIAGMVIPCFFTQSPWGPAIGILVAVALIIFILFKVYPVWFGDYIKEFEENEKKRYN